MNFQMTSITIRCMYCAYGDFFTETYYDLTVNHLCCVMIGNRISITVESVFLFVKNQRLDVFTTNLSESFISQYLFLYDLIVIYEHWLHANYCTAVYVTVNIKSVDVNTCSLDEYYWSRKLRKKKKKIKKQLIIYV